MRYFGIDGWFIYGDMQYRYATPLETEKKEVSRSAERIVIAERTRTPAGDLTTETTYYIADPPTVTVKAIKDPKEDWPKLRYLFQEPIGYDPSLLQVQRKELGEQGILGVGLATPGFQAWFGVFHGGIEALTYLYQDHPELVEELRLLHERSILKEAEMVIEARPDFILTGGSGAITLQSPALVRKLSLPTLKKTTRMAKEAEMVIEARPDFILTGGSGAITLQSPTLARKLNLPTLKKTTHMAKEAGVLTMVHCCGYEYELVKMCAEETNLDCINPLEEPPMGDCYLARIKREFGERLSLMGNLHTTNIMLLGSPPEVERAARQAIDDAAADGGFILSTGDQCGRDTPDENIRKLVEVCKTYGRYD